MDRRQILTTCAATLAIGMLLCGGCMLWLRSQTTYYASEYREASVVDSGSNEASTGRFFPVELEHCRLEIAWNTYDNSDITAGPYKLFVVVAANSPQLERVQFVSVDIRSSLGRTYTLGPDNEPVLDIAVDHREELSSAMSSRALAFDFEGKEEITTTMVVQFVLGSEVATKTLTLRWKPVRVRHWAPMR